MSLCKLLGCKALYELCAAAIASWFRRKTIRNVFNELHMEVSYPYPYQLDPEEIRKAKEKFEHFIGKIEYPQLYHHLHRMQQQKPQAQPQMQQQMNKDDPSNWGRHGGGQQPHGMMKAPSGMNPIYMESVQAGGQPPVDMHGMPPGGPMNNDL